MDSDVQIELAFDKLSLIGDLLSMGFTIALVVAVIIAGVKLGWKAWPWILGIGAIAWIFF
jgi:hypothetical protein